MGARSFAPTRTRWAAPAAGGPSRPAVGFRPLARNGRKSPVVADRTTCGVRRQQERWDGRRRRSARCSRRHRYGRAGTTAAVRRFRLCMGARRQTHRLDAGAQRRKSGGHQRPRGRRRLRARRDGYERLLGDLWQGRPGNTFRQR